MAERVIMPKQGLQMTEGTIMQWFVGEGEECIEGEPLFEMETDKLTITMDSPATGTLLKIVRLAGETVPITETIAVIGQKGEDISSLLAEDAAAGAHAGTEESQKADASAVSVFNAAAEIGGQRIFSTPRARMAANERRIDIAAVAPTGPDHLIIERDVLNYEEVGVKASPLAKKIASQTNIDLRSVAGTGAHGKIMRRDVEGMGQDDEIVVVAESAPTQRGERLIPLTGMREVIGNRMQESLRNHAQLSHTVRADMTNATALRNVYKKVDQKVSYNDLVLMAVSRALMEFPMMNATITPKGILRRDYVNLGVAVAVENGLIVPNIKNADQLRLLQIGKASKELAQKAKDNKLTLDEMSGGTFTVSNLGMFGLDEFVAIINTPESGILALGAITKTPVVIEDEIVIRPMMSMTLTYDHRIVDGAPAAQFLVKVKQYVENPSLML